MSEVLFESDAVLVKYQNESKIFEYQWKPRATELSDEEYRSAMLSVMQQVEALQPRLVVANTKHSSFTIRVEMQKWVAENVIAPAARLGMKKLALVVSSDLIIQLSVEQSLDETVERPFETKYFDEAAAAYQWLKGFVKNY